MTIEWWEPEQRMSDRARQVDPQITHLCDLTQNLMVRALAGSHFDHVLETWERGCLMAGNQVLVTLRSGWGHRFGRSPPVAVPSWLVNERLLIPRPGLVVADPFARALQFFSTDISSVGTRSYDSYVMAGTSPTNRIVIADITAINSTMRARSPHSDWATLMTRGNLPPLAGLSTELDLFLTSEAAWKAHRVVEHLSGLFEAVLGPGIGISRATKVLHIKRPRLVPVCDSYVLRLMGIPGDDGRSAVALIEHMRSIRGELRPVLRAVQKDLRKRGYDRTLVRIADALVWSSFPDTWLSRASATAGA